jgi:hypothetical protein
MIPITHPAWLVILVILLIFVILAVMLIVSRAPASRCERHRAKKRLVTTWEELDLPDRQPPIKCRSGQMCCPDCQKEERARKEPYPIG